MTLYYVSAQRGDDTNNGTDPATPWATITKAVVKLRREIRSISAPELTGRNLFYPQQGQTEARLYGFLIHRLNM